VEMAVDDDEAGIQMEGMRETITILNEADYLTINYSLYWPTDTCYHWFNNICILSCYIFSSLS